MLLQKDPYKGVRTGISQQLFEFDTPIAEVSTIACHSLPASWGSYLLPNEAGDKCAVFHLERSPHQSADPESDAYEEWRPHNGDMWIFHGSSKDLRDSVKKDEHSFIHGLEHVKLDQSKTLAASLIELHEQGKF